MDRGSVSFTPQLGPMLMGTLFTYFLGGVYAMQLFHYWTHYAASDRVFFKILVAVTTCVEVAHMVVSTDLIYYSVVRNYANPAALFISPVGTLLIPLLNGIVGFCVHIFFIWRITVMSKSHIGKAAAAVILIIALLSLSAGTTATIRYYGPGINREVFKATAAVRVPMSIWFSASAACDVLITATLVSLLWSAKKMAEFSPSRGILNLLIAHTIENGLVTAVCATADQITFFALPALNLTYLCLAAVLGRMYAIVLLTSLNGRDRTRKQLSSTNSKLSPSSYNADNTRNTDDMHMSAFDASLSRGNQTQSTTSKAFPVISVTTDIESRSGDEKYNDHKMYS